MGGVERPEGDVPPPQEHDDERDTPEHRDLHDGRAGAAEQVAEEDLLEVRPGGGDGHEDEAEGEQRGEDDADRRVAAQRRPLPHRPDEPDGDDRGDERAHGEGHADDVGDDDPRQHRV